MTDFTAYDQAELDAFQEEAKARWGQTSAYQAFESKHSSSDFSKKQEKMNQILVVFGKMKDLPASDNKVQEQVKVLQDFITDNFYPGTKEILVGLEKMYVADERFTENIDSAGGQRTAEFITQAIEIYCQ